MRRLWVLGVVILMSAVSTAALADDWLADKLRGPVLQFVDKQWQPLERGMIVPDSRAVRTLATGHVTFTRGGETVELGPNTQIQIFDKGGAKPFTTVKEAMGTVSIEAQVRNIQHFAVETPYLAAVVKGTRFTVASGKTGSRVDVRRGHVEVDNKGDKSRVLLSVGQSALVDSLKTGGATAVSGDGKLPTVVNSKGEPMTTASTASAGSTGAGSSRSGDLGLSLGVGSGGLDANAGVGGLSASASAGGGGLSVGVSAGNTSVGVTAGSSGLGGSLCGLHLRL